MQFIIESAKIERRHFKAEWALFAPAQEDIIHESQKKDRQRMV